MIEMFAKVDSLPGSEIQFPICNGDGKGRTQKREVDSKVKQSNNSYEVFDGYSSSTPAHFKYFALSSAIC